MKKVFLGIFLALNLFFTSSPTFAATNQMKIDGVMIVSDVNPEIKNNRTMVPLRVISENLGALVNWSGSQVTLTKNDMQVILKLNSKQVVVNGNSKLLDEEPYVKNNRTFVPLRFLAETFGCNVHYKNGIVAVNAKPLVIDGVEVSVLQHEYHMTMGGVVEHIKGNGYNETIYNTFVQNKGSKIEPPSDYTWSFHHTTIGGYYKGGQYDFLDQEGNSIKRFDLYSLVRNLEGTLPSQPLALIYDANENQWYTFSDTAGSSIYQLMDTAWLNGFVTVISNTVP